MNKQKAFLPKLISSAEISEYRRLADIDTIARRALANNCFDGILTIIGVLMGSYVSGVQDPHIVLYTGVSTCVAIGVSGAWGRYMAESAERKHEMQQLEQAMLLDMTETKQARASRFAVVIISAVDGLSPLIAGMVAVLPFFFANLMPDILYTYIASLIMALVSLFLLGAFLAKVAKGNMIRSGLCMITAGLACVLLSFLLHGRS